MCDCCNLWSHTKCNNIDCKDYKSYQNDENRSFFCKKCNEKIIPFAKLNDSEYDSVVTKGDLLPRRNVNFTNFAPSQYQKAMFDKLNKEIEDYNFRLANDESESDYNHPLTCNYYDVPEFVECEFNSYSNLSILHLNIHSIQLHIDELRNLLSMLNHSFDIIALSESKLKNDPVTNINIDGYQIPRITNTESEKGGTMLYVLNGINFKPRNDLEIYQSKELESTLYRNHKSQGK